METLGESYWFTLIREADNETEDQGEGVENASPIPGGTESIETPDPDFEEVSMMLLDGNNTSTEMETESNETDSNETVDYSTMLENISVQIGVLDICLVLYLLIWIIKQFVRVPR